MPQLPRPLELVLLAYRYHEENTQQGISDVEGNSSKSRIYPLDWEHEDGAGQGRRRARLSSTVQR